PQNDDEFEKYEPRPKIVIDKRDFEPSRPYNGHCSEPTPPSLRISAQHVHQKDAVIVKVISLHGCDLLADEASQICFCRQCCGFVSILGAAPQLSDRPTHEHSEAPVPIAAVKRSSERSQALSDRERICWMDGSMTYTQMYHYLNNAGLSPSMHRVSNGSVASGDSRRNSMVDACGRFCSQPTNGAPELLIALCYDTDHGCLTVGIERGSSLGDKNRPTDTFIKIVALGEFGNELWRQKTEVVKGCSEPQYDHAASIQLHRPDLDVCTVRIEVWSSVGVLRRRQMLGWLAMGLNSSSPDAQEHWEQMIQQQKVLQDEQPYY
ncbi:C2 domain protein, partial [Teladorsagia circumcincta]